MKKQTILSVFFCLFCALCLCAQDKLAIAQPAAKGGITPEEIEAFWGMLEASVPESGYKLITRAALQQMLTEIGLTTNSGLVNLDDSQKAKLGKLETVKYILVPEIGRFGTKINCTMKVIDASTGEILPARTSNLRVMDLDELGDRIESEVKLLLSNEKQLNRAAILAPVVAVPKPPAYLAGDFNVLLENSLLEKGVRLQNLQSVGAILTKNKLDNLYELEPKMFVRVGKLLEVNQLIQATITRFEIAAIPYKVEETGAQGIRFIGSMEGTMRIISAQTGETLGSYPFAGKIDFRRLSRQETRDWTVDDYGKCMIRTFVPELVLPPLLQLVQPPQK